MPAHDVQFAGTRHQGASCFVHQHLKDRHALSADHWIPDQGPKEPGHGNRLQSRLLTKTQLADMTRGVRELSKQLGSVRLKLQVKTIFLLVKVHDESLMALSRELVDWLLSTEQDTPYVV